ncbi:hypothetical protein [Mycobacterium sp. NAZ190054]|uniref:hypothetical protein n=1 Tax=Mycobacterium sp. NAZ190054 TaxID=1747766 RepID=UPI000797359D|nr:hypothetical protein [Mycobacterium sp. NAZ190054]KWX57047.1 hypothetical protein ASJ79_02000 [Mycobacterium sp. NAZ190054]
MQRTAPLQSRLRDSELGFTAPSSTVALSPGHLASTVVNLIDEMITTAKQLHGFMAVPAFMAAFTGKGDQWADPEAIKHIASHDGLPGTALGALGTLPSAAGAIRAR